MTTYSAGFVAKRLQTVMNAWANISPDKSFSGMTLEQFKAAVKPSLDLRDRETVVKAGLKDVRSQRLVTDEASMKQLLMVVNAVKGDPSEGENGSLYSAMGYVPKYARRSGLTRKGATTAPTTQTATNN